MSDDICSNHHGGNQLSLKAFEQVNKSAGSIRDEIVALARTRGKIGICAHEAKRILHLDARTAGARCTELKAAGRLVETQDTRKTPAGNDASVLCVPEFCDNPKPYSSRRRKKFDVDKFVTRLENRIARLSMNVPLHGEHSVRVQGALHELTLVLKAVEEMRK